MNLLELISGTDNYTLHTHTQYCDGHADMSTMADAAVAAGMKVYGFSPHSPIPFDSPCNMKEDDVPLYLDEVEAIRHRHAGCGCTFLAGMEVDYVDASWGPANAYFQSLPLDFIIASVHFIPNQGGVPTDIDGKYENFKRKMADMFHGDIDYVVETYYRQSMDMLRLGSFDILGHLDKVGQNASYYAPGIEEGEHYRGLIDEYITRIINSGVIIELNTKALAEHHRVFPNEIYLPRLVAAGVPIVVNSDAHYPDRINAGRAEGFRMLRLAAKQAGR